MDLALGDSATRLLIGRSKIRISSGLGVQKDGGGRVLLLGWLLVAYHVSIFVHVVDLDSFIADNFRC